MAVTSALTWLSRSSQCWRQATSAYLSTLAFHPHIPMLRCRMPSYVSLPPRRINRLAGTRIRLLSSQVPPIPASRAVVQKSPTPQELEEAEMEADLIPEDEVQLMLTDRAAQQLKLISSREGNSHAAIRISVESGGCHGFQYKIELTTQRGAGDYHLIHPGVQPSNLYIDPISLSMINGSTVDFATELIGSSFRVVDNPHAKGGCGCGVSWEMK
ncbi:hypothetical protein F5141DRAFT_1002289 [Pisolithus sp. B1]|nr:hypothetical protein F5141DRAFT_1002289 [Pisolithus sp. B1]